MRTRVGRGEGQPSPAPRNCPLSPWSWSKGRNRRYAYYHCPPKAHCRRTNIPRHELEAKFLGLLEQLRPRPEFLALFRRIVLDVWNTRKQDVEAQRRAAERKVAELKRRKDQLLEAFIYQKLIDQQTYKNQLDKLNEGLALAEMEQHGQRSEELDVEAVLAFAERVSLNAARMWLESNLSSPLVEPLSKPQSSSARWQLLAQDPGFLRRRPSVPETFC
jgi:hypothetical protein